MVEEAQSTTREELEEVPKEREPQAIPHGRTIFEDMRMGIQELTSQKNMHWGPFTKKASSKLEEEREEDNDNIDFDLGSNMGMESEESKVEQDQEPKTPTPIQIKTQLTIKSPFRAMMVLMTLATTKR